MAGLVGGFDFIWFGWWVLCGLLFFVWAFGFCFACFTLGLGCFLLWLAVLCFSGGKEGL